MAIDVKLLKEIREETSASVSDIREALDEAKGNKAKALELLKKRGEAIAAKKSDREIKSGLVETYVHGGGKIGVIVELGCETDFVAKTDDFKTLAHEVAMQISAMNPENVEELLSQEYIRDSSKTIEAMVKETIAKLGENIQIRRFERYGLGE